MCLIYRYRQRIKANLLPYFRRSAHKQSIISGNYTLFIIVNLFGERFWIIINIQVFPRLRLFGVVGYLLTIGEFFTFRFCALCREFGILARVAFWKNFSESEIFPWLFLVFWNIPLLVAVVSDVTDPSTFFIGTISYKIFSPLAELAILSIAFQTVFSLSWIYVAQYSRMKNLQYNYNRFCV